VRIDDSQPPSTPVVTATLGGHDVQLVWTPSTDNVALDDYIVSRNAHVLGRTTATTFTDPSVPDHSALGYTVTAIDTDGNAAPSVVAIITTPDWTPPTAPTGLSLNINGGTAILTWQAGTDSVGIVAYDVQRDSLPSVATPALSYTDSPVPAGTHVWQVRSRDAAEPSNVSGWATISGISSGPQPVVKIASDTSGSFKHARNYVLGGKHHGRMRITLLLTGKAAVKLRLHVLSGHAAIVVNKAGRKGKRLASARPSRGIVNLRLGSLPAGTTTVVLTCPKGSDRVAGMKSSHQLIPTVAIS
jgi:hypothetical protein